VKIVILHYIGVQLVYTIMYLRKIWYDMIELMERW